MEGRRGGVHQLLMTTHMSFLPNTYVLHFIQTPPISNAEKTHPCSLLHSTCEKTATGGNSFRDGRWLFMAPTAGYCRAVTLMKWCWNCQSLELCWCCNLWHHMHCSPSGTFFHDYRLFFPESLNNIIVIHKSYWVHKYAAKIAFANDRLFFVYILGNE